MTNKIIVAKSGINVLTVTDPDDIIYSSDYDTLKYESTGEQVVSVDRADYYHHTPASFPFPDFYFHRKVETLEHGLGYTPYFVGYGIFATQTIQTPFYFGDVGFVEAQSVYADSTYLYFMVNYNTSSNTGTDDFTFRYRIFKNDTGL